MGSSRKKRVEVGAVGRGVIDGRVTGVIAALAAILIGCGGEPGPASGHTVTDSAGIEIVESQSPAWSAARRIDPEPLVRLGREAGGPDEFSFVADAVLLTDGRVAVADAGTQDVRLFDAEGRLIRTFGREGEGPGEFTGLSGVFLYRADTLAAWDGRQRRATFFEIASRAFRTLSFRHQGDWSYSVFGVMGDGTLLLHHFGGSFRPDLEPGLQWTPSDVVAMDPSDGSSRVIAILPLREQVVRSDGNAEQPIPSRFAVQAGGEAGFYWATPDRYEVRFYDGEGALRRILRRPVEPSSVTDAMVDRDIESRIERMVDVPGAPSAARLRARYEDATIVESAPLFDRALVDGDGRLWLSESTWPEGGEAKRWNLFGPGGIWLGNVEAPEPLRILDARGDTVLALRHNELDVPFVQLHRIGRRP